MVWDDMSVILFFYSSESRNILVSLNIQPLRDVILACTPTRNVPAGVSFVDVFPGCPRQLLPRGSTSCIPAVVPGNRTLVLRTGF